tara:strand:- start:401 stop:1162 length:762 start_codon:yes stop_codon:yes gene_type:complete
MVVNIGEKSEIYLKAYLLREKDKKYTNTIFKRITQLSDDGNLDELKWIADAEEYLQSYDIENLKKELKIAKSHSSSKSDITINDVNYSVKDVGGAPPSIINHTTRPGFERVCKYLEVDIATLDKIIDDYWDKRMAGDIKEDVINSDSDSSPFFVHKDYLEPIINYFTFTGTGSKDSDFPADKILELDYVNLPESIKISEKRVYFDSTWKSLQISVRSKAMPEKYPNCKNSKSIGKWTRSIQGKNRGSFHIRVR